MHILIVIRFLSYILVTGKYIALELWGCCFFHVICTLCMGAILSLLQTCNFSCVETNALNCLRLTDKMSTCLLSICFLWCQPFSFLFSWTLQVLLEIIVFFLLLIVFKNCSLVSPLSYVI